MSEVFFLPGTVAQALSVLGGRFNPDVHHQIAVLKVLADHGFKGCGMIGTEVLAGIDEHGLVWKTLEFDHDNWPGISFEWHVEGGEFLIFEASDPETAVIQEDDINDIIGWAVEGVLVKHISDAIGEEHIEQHSWAELIEQLQDLEPHSTDEQAQKLQKLVEEFRAELN